MAPNEIPQVLVYLNALLQKAHINTCPAILFYAHEYRLDVAKACYVPYSSLTLLSCLQDQYRGGHYKQALTFYPGAGHMVASALKLRKVAFYNKSAELLQDKRAPEEIKAILKNLPGTFYRFECSLKTAKEIKRELAVCGIALQSCCLQELSKTDVVRTVLQKNLERSLQHWHIPDRNKALTQVCAWTDQKRYSNTRCLYIDVALVIGCVFLGVKCMRKLVEEKLGKRQAREFMHQFEKLELEDVNCLAVFKEKFMKEIKMLNPLNETYLEELTRKEIVNEDDRRLFALVLLAITEMLISHPFGDGK